MNQDDAIDAALAEVADDPEGGDVHVMGPPEGTMRLNSRYCDAPEPPEMRGKTEVLYHREVFTFGSLSIDRPTLQTVCAICGHSDVDGES